MTLTDHNADALIAEPSQTEWWDEEFAPRNAWHAIEHVPNVERGVVRRVLHQQPYYIRREDSRLRATPFHPDAPIRKRRATEFTDAQGDYPLVERYGYVWAWYGTAAEADPGLVPHVPYLPVEGGLPPHTWGSSLFDCAFSLACENSLDTTHAEYLHFGVVGLIEAETDQVEVIDTEETVTIIRHAHNRIVPPTTKGVRLLPKEAHDIEFVNHVALRNGITMIRSVVTPPGITDYLFIAYVPEGRYRTRMSWTQYQVGGDGSKIVKALLKPVMMVATTILPLRLADEDNLAFVQQQHNYIERPRRSADCSSPHDVAGIAFRRRMRELMARQGRGDYSYSPESRPGGDIAGLLRMPPQDVKTPASALPAAD